MVFWYACGVYTATYLDNPSWDKRGSDGSGRIDSRPTLGQIAPGKRHGDGQPVCRSESSVRDVTHGGIETSSIGTRATKHDGRRTSRCSGSPPGPRRRRHQSSLRTRPSALGRTTTPGTIALASWLCDAWWRIGVCHASLPRDSRCNGSS